MFKSIIAISSIMTVLVTGSYAGQSGNYVGASAGILLSSSSTLAGPETASTVTFDTPGTAVSVCVGHQFGVGLRVEEELFYKKAVSNTRFTKLLLTDGTFGFENKSFDPVFWSVGGMSNLYYDWFHNIDLMNDRWYSPYVMAGVGVAYLNISADSDKLLDGGSDTAFAYQYGIGSSARIYKDIVLDVSYRYFDAKNFNINKLKADFANHNILFGFRYMFKQ